MSSWKELTDFSSWDKRFPCVLCKGDSEKTLVGEHWKCGTCDHLFNQDGAALPEGVACYCEICNPKKKKDEGLAQQTADNCSNMFPGEVVPIHKEIKKGRWAVVDNSTGKIIEAYDLPKLPNGKFMKPFKPYDVEVLKKIRGGGDLLDLEKGSFAQVSCDGKHLSLGLYGDGGSGTRYKSHVKEGKDFKFVGFPKKKLKKG